MQTPRTAGATGPSAGATALPETIEVETGANPTHSVIWLHGLGADGHDFEPVVPMLGLAAEAAIRFVFPHAPVRPVTLNGGMPMRAWYDIASLTASRDQDEAGIAASSELVHALIAREVERGVPVERQVIAGFSQGAAMALHTGLRYPGRLAGIIALSGYLLLPQRLAEDGSEANRDVPLFMAHGSQDMVVAYAYGSQSAEHLKAAGYSLEWHSYPIPHSVSPQELLDIGSFLNRHLS